MHRIVELWQLVSEVFELSTAPTLILFVRPNWAGAIR